MTADFWILVGSALAAAWGAAATLSLKPRIRWAIPALLVFTLVGVHTILFLILDGHGRILPGLQVNPHIVEGWGERIARGGWPAPHASYTFAVIVAHLCVHLGRPERAALVRPLPATLAFVALYFALEARRPEGPIVYEGAGLPDGTVAYLTIVPEDDVRFVLSAGSREETFLSVLYTHESETPPPRPLRVYWTKDRRGVVVRVLGRNLLGVALDGSVAGALPREADLWPREDRSFEPPAARSFLSEAQKDVGLFIRDHGGLFVG